MDKLPKPKKVVMTKNLSGLGGVNDVSFGAAPPERRAQGDYSKDGIPKPDMDALDDYREKQERFERVYNTL